MSPLSKTSYFSQENFTILSQLITFELSKKHVFNEQSKQELHEHIFSSMIQLYESCDPEKATLETLNKQCIMNILNTFQQVPKKEEVETRFSMMEQQRHEESNPKRPEPIDFQQLNPLIPDRFENPKDIYTTSSLLLQDPRDDSQNLPYPSSSTTHAQQTVITYDQPIFHNVDHDHLQRRTWLLHSIDRDFMIGNLFECRIPIHSSKYHHRPSKVENDVILEFEELHDVVTRNVSQDTSPLLNLDIQESNWFLQVNFVYLPESFSMINEDLILVEIPELQWTPYTFLRSSSNSRFYYPYQERKLKLSTQDLLHLPYITIKIKNRYASPMFPILRDFGYIKNIHIQPSSSLSDKESYDLYCTLYDTYTVPEHPFKTSIPVIFRFIEIPSTEDGDALSSYLEREHSYVPVPHNKHQFYIQDVPFSSIDINYNLTDGFCIFPSNVYTCHLQLDPC